MLQIKVNNKPEIEFPEFSTETVKDDGKTFKQITVTETGYIGARGLTWKEAKENLNKGLERVKIVDMAALHAFIADQKLKKIRNESWENNSRRLALLLKIGRVPRDFLLYLLGDNVIDMFALEKIMGIGENRSIREVAMERGGTVAVQLIERMI